MLNREISFLCMTAAKIHVAVIAAFIGNAERLLFWYRVKMIGRLFQIYKC